MITVCQQLFKLHASNLIELNMTITMSSTSESFRATYPASGTAATPALRRSARLAASQAATEAHSQNNQRFKSSTTQPSQSTSCSEPPNKTPHCPGSISSGKVLIGISLLRIPMNTPQRRLRKIKSGLVVYGLGSQLQYPRSFCSLPSLFTWVSSAFKITLLISGTTVEEKPKIPLHPALFPLESIQTQALDSLQRNGK